MLGLDLQGGARSCSRPAAEQGQAAQSPTSTRRSRSCATASTRSASRSPRSARSPATASWSRWPARTTRRSLRPRRLDRQALLLRPRGGPRADVVERRGRRGREGVAVRAAEAGEQRSSRAEASEHLVPLRRQAEAARRPDGAKEQLVASKVVEVLEPKGKLPKAEDVRRAPRTVVLTCGVGGTSAPASTRRAEDDLLLPLRNACSTGQNGAGADGRRPGRGHGRTSTRRPARRSSRWTSTAAADAFEDITTRPRQGAPTRSGDRRGQKVTAALRGRPRQRAQDLPDDRLPGHYPDGIKGGKRADHRARRPAARPRTSRSCCSRARCRWSSSRSPRPWSRPRSARNRSIRAARGHRRPARRRDLHAHLLPVPRPHRRHRAADLRGAVLRAILAIPVTMTLPGIAGMILTIGVAADANVVIFERIKEEVRAGKTVRAAISAGYSKGFRRSSTRTRSP